MRLHIFNFHYIFALSVESIFIKQRGDSSWLTSRGISSLTNVSNSPRSSVTWESLWLHSRRHTLRFFSTSACLTSNWDAWYFNHFRNSIWVSWFKASEVFFSTLRLMLLSLSWLWGVKFLVERVSVHLRSSAGQNKHVHLHTAIAAERNSDSYSL